MISKKVLIVDDERMILETFEAFLSIAGCECLTAESVAVARDLLKDNTIDVVISDLKMPEEDGMSLVQYLNDYYSHLPVIIITGNPETAVTHEAYRQGIVEFLVKPVRKKELIEAVEKVFHSESELDGEQEEIENLLGTLRDE